MHYTGIGVQGIELSGTTIPEVSLRLKIGMLLGKNANMQKLE